MLARFGRILMVACLAVALSAACVDEQGRNDRFDDDGSSSSQASGGGASSSGSSAGGATAVGGGGSAATSTTTSSTSSGAGGACVDDGPEPNDSEATAIDYGVVSDCTSNATIEGVLAGDDVDWYSYTGSDDFGIGCSVDPFCSLVADGQVRICKFFECDGLSVTCPQGSTDEISPNGRVGCCGLNSLEVSIDCSGISDDAVVYIRLDKPPAFPCVSYALSHHY